MAEFLALADALLQDRGGWVVVVALVALAIAGLWRGWWVLRPQYREKADDAAELRKTVDRMTAAELVRARRKRRDDP